MASFISSSVGGLWFSAFEESELNFDDEEVAELADLVADGYVIFDLPGSGGGTGGGGGGGGGISLLGSGNDDDRVLVAVADVVIVLALWAKFDDRSAFGGIDVVIADSVLGAVVLDATDSLAD